MPHFSTAMACRLPHWSSAPCSALREPNPGSTPNRNRQVPANRLTCEPAVTVPKPRRQHGGTGIGADRDIAVPWRYCSTLGVSADRAANRAAHTRGKPRLLDVGRRIPARDRFAPDSPLEGDGFELPVPLTEAR